MASGGGPSSRYAYSEPRNRSAAYRLSNHSVEQEDNRSVGSGRMDDRPNNWVGNIEFGFYFRNIPLDLL